MVNTERESNAFLGPRGPLRIPLMSAPARPPIRHLQSLINHPDQTSRTFLELVLWNWLAWPCNRHIQNTGHNRFSLKHSQKVIVREREILDRVRIQGKCGRLWRSALHRKADVLFVKHRNNCECCPSNKDCHELDNVQLCETQI